MKKLLALNRGEIAIRILRAATELGLRTVAVYSQEDRLSLHRFKADEAYLIGEGKGPGPGLSRRRRHRRARRGKGRGRDPSRLRISLGEPGAAARLRAAGITFVGPSARSARAAGRQDGRPASRRRRPEIPDVPGTRGPVTDPRAGRERSPREIGFPLIIKAAFGGGGRGMRVVERPEDFAGTPGRSAPGSGRGVRQRRRVPRALSSAAPSTSKCRSSATSTATSCTCTSATARCSAAIRRSWKSRPPSTSIRSIRARTRRRRGHDSRGQPATTTPARSNSWSTRIRGEWFFIEVNPRIQVEHTVTEMVTGIDLVRSQIQIAQGHDAARARDEPAAAGRGAAARLRAAVPHHHRGSGEQLHAGLRQDSHLPLARRLRHPAGWRIGVRRRGHHAVLRFAAGEGDGVGPRLSSRRASAWTARCASSAFAA